MTSLSSAYDNSHPFYLTLLKTTLFKQPSPTQEKETETSEAEQTPLSHNLADLRQLSPADDITFP